MDAVDALWAKKSSANNQHEQWLPLSVHLRETAEIVRLLWIHWLPGCIKNSVASGILVDGKCVGPEIALKIVIFLAYCHDIGKTSPLFELIQIFKSNPIDESLIKKLIGAGFIFKEHYEGKKETRHELVSHMILIHNQLHESLAVVAGGHHGIPPSSGQINDLLEHNFDDACGFNDQKWIAAQDEIFNNALSFTGLTHEYIKTVCLTRTAQALICSLVILADWIASDQKNMPLIPLGTYDADSKRRTRTAIENIKLPSTWDPEWDVDHLYERRFSLKELRPIQSALTEAVASCRKPGLFIVEAPMGEGKTEAALVAAELLANRAGCRGIYFALPTQATSDAMFDRVVDWIKTFQEGKRYSVQLSHRKAKYNEKYGAIRFSDAINTDGMENTPAEVHEWTSGRKRGLFADFTVGTIDQVLMAALKQRHLVLRHLGLSGKVVIIDECHAYDVYMESYLLAALKWLGAYGTPVIVLSATLTSARRREIIEAYTSAVQKPKEIGFPWNNKINDPETENDKDNKESTDITYPLITFTDENKVQHINTITANRKTEIKFVKTDEEKIIDILRAALAGGGHAGIILNTVTKTQRIYARLKEELSAEVCLLHGRFIIFDRGKLEEKLISRLGPPGKADRSGTLAAVGTQVFEQSMDIDFDVMITELCPIDLLLQRVGRLFRHERKRPEYFKTPVCYVMNAEWDDFDSGSEAIYGRYMLMRSLAALPDSVALPDGIPRLVEEVYDGAVDIIPADVLTDYKRAKEAWNIKLQKRKTNAEHFQISGPSSQESLIDWLDLSFTDDTEIKLESAVRDGTDSIEVILIQRRDDKLCFLPWIEGGRELQLSVPDDGRDFLISSCSVRLPAAFGIKERIDIVINEIKSKMKDEEIYNHWNKSRQLKGRLFLIMDEVQETSLNGYRLRYDHELGLCYKKEESN